jgi:hypothetical protein
MPPDHRPARRAPVGGALGRSSSGDGDGVDERLDNCRGIVDGDQADADGGNMGDACDNGPGTLHAGQRDGDRIGDVCDESSGGNTTNVLRRLRIR